MCSPWLSYRQELDVPLLMCRAYHKAESSGDGVIQTRNCSSEKHKIKVRTTIHCGVSIVLLGSGSVENDHAITLLQPLVDHRQDFRKVGKSENVIVFVPIRATFNAQSARHGARPGFEHAPRCTRALSACPDAESARKDPRPEEKRPLMCRTRACRTVHTLFVQQVKYAHG